MIRSVILTFATLCCVGAFAVKPVWGQLDPQLRVLVAIETQTAYLGHLPTPEIGLDPWARPWGSFQDGCVGSGPYSVGPNGVNDLGQGDDIRPHPDAIIWGTPSQAVLRYRWSREALLLLGIWLATLWIALYVLRRRSSGLRQECAYATLVALPAAPLCVALAVWCASHPALKDTGSLAVPPGVAVGNTALLLAWLGALFMRTRLDRSLEPPAPARSLRLALTLLLVGIAGEAGAFALDRLSLAESGRPHGLSSNHHDTGAPGLGSVGFVFREHCGACHFKGSDLGRPVQGLYGSLVELESGETVLADEAFIRRSILDPGAQITKGFPLLMIDDYRAKLKPNEIEWLVDLYKQSGVGSELGERGED